MSEGEIEIPDFETPFDSDEIKGYSHEEDDDLVPSDPEENTKCLESDRDTALKAECLRRQLVIKLKRIVPNANNEVIPQNEIKSSVELSDDEEKPLSALKKRRKRNGSSSIMKLNGKINGQFFKKKRKRRHCDQDSPLQDLEEEMQSQAIVNFTCLPTNLNSEDIMLYCRRINE